MTAVCVFEKQTISRITRAGHHKRNEFAVGSYSRWWWEAMGNSV
jgi:hypothetical protein